MTRRLTSSVDVASGPCRCLDEPGAASCGSAHLSGFLPGPGVLRLVPRRYGSTVELASWLCGLRPGRRARLWRRYSIVIENEPRRFTLMARAQLHNTYRIPPRNGLESLHTRGFLCAFNSHVEVLLCAAWLGLRGGSRLSINDSLAHWISWAPEETLLRGCTMLPRERVVTPRGEFRRHACVFRGYYKVNSLLARNGLLNAAAAAFFWRRATDGHGSNLIRTAADLQRQSYPSSEWLETGWLRSALKCITNHAYSNCLCSSIFMLLVKAITKLFGE